MNGLMKFRMRTIQGGCFKRGDEKAVAVSPFSMSIMEFTKAEWDKTKAYANAIGYDLSEGSGRGRLPVGNITWYDAVKAANALSEMTGRTPVYYEDEGHASIYRKGVKAFLREGGFRPGRPAWYYQGDRFIP